MTTKFKVGDMVKLKSGSPEMTISAIPELAALGAIFDEYQCKWFLGKKLQHGSFQAAALVKATPVKK